MMMMMMMMMGEAKETRQEKLVRRGVGQRNGSSYLVDMN
jgi:hypothetical protein